MHTSPDLELPGGGGEPKKTRTSSKSEPDTPTPTLPSATPDYAAGLGVEFPPATPTSSRAVVGGGDVTGGAAAASGKKGALELALQSPTTSLASDSQKPQVCSSILNVEWFTFEVSPKSLASFLFSHCHCNCDDCVGSHNNDI